MEASYSTASSDTLSSSALMSNELAANMSSSRLDRDVPIPSTEADITEEGSDDSSGGISISRGTSHSRTPSLSLPPPPAEVNEIRPLARDEGSRRLYTSLDATRSIDARLNMLELAPAIEDIARNSDRPNGRLHLESPAAGNDSSRRTSGGRFSPRSNMLPHFVRDEEPPQDRFHDPAFQRAFSDARHFMFELADVLSNSSFSNEPDSTIRRLLEETKNLARFHCPSTRIVGFVGDSGAGKSSLLNSLLDSKDLARASSSGAACTCVVTEYYYHDSDDFAIEVEWFSMSEIAAQLSELLTSYRHFHLRGAAIDQQDSQNAKERADIAQKTFRAMFQQRLGDEGFLTQLPEETVMVTLRAWAEELGSPLTHHREIQTSLGDCSTLLMQLTSEPNSIQEPAKWPYIRKIKVFLRSDILSKGLVLVDLPGLRDLNSARRNITERYLLHCDEIFAVCQIGRATTDTSVMSVFELARQANLRNVGIICTRSDDIRPEEAKRDWHGETSRKIELLIHAKETGRQDWENIQEEIYSYGEDNNLSEKEAKEISALTLRSRQAKRREDQHDFELKQYLVNTRNERVTQLLDGLYRDKIPGNDPKIFCISNRDYWDKRNRPRDEAFDFLQLSGILNVRKHCIAMVADSQLRIATQYLRDDIPAHLGDIELWVQSGAGSLEVERKEAIRETLNTVEARLRRELTGSSSRVGTIAKSFKRIFRTQIGGGQHIHDWTVAASNASQVWFGWSHGSFSAFCRNFGKHYTKKAGRHDWNEEVIQGMTRDLAAPWRDLRTNIQSIIDENYTAIEKLMESAIEYLETELQDPAHPTSCVSEAMASRQRLLLTDIEQLHERFRADLSTLHTDAFSGIRTSFIGQLMEESYNECNQDKGDGSDMRRKGIIESRLENEMFFEMLQISFRNRFRTLAENLQSDIQASVATHLTVITNTLDIVRDENIALESERDPEFRGRVETKVLEVIRGIRRLHNVIGP